jgi:predicted DNA binding CopG/RHH family protein
MKKIPKFKSEAEERRFWRGHDSSEYVDWSKAKEASLPNLKPSTQTISLRLPESMVEGLKALANKRDVPYQSLLKVFLAERLEAEYARMARDQRRDKKASTWVEATTGDAMEAEG